MGKICFFQLSLLDQYYYTGTINWWAGATTVNLRQSLLVIPELQLSFNLKKNTLLYL